MFVNSLRILCDHGDLKRIRKIVKLYFTVENTFVKHIFFFKITQSLFIIIALNQTTCRKIVYV